MKRVTIYEVAKEANVSLATVSRVMNGSNVVKSATKEKVESAIAKLGYRPNAIAQGLALQKTTTIGLIFPENSISHTAQIINGLCDVAKIYNYNISFHTISEGITNIQEVIDGVIKSRVDGVILFSNKNLDDSYKLLDEYQIPLVVIGNRVKCESVCSVYIDYLSAVNELVSDYLAKGKKKVYVVEDRRNYNITRDMLDGAKAAFKKHKLSFDNYIEYSHDERSTYKYLRSWFKTHKDIDLMIVSRDSQALAVLNAANDNDLNVPNDFELVCMNDSKYDSMVRPQISGFVVPSYDLGAVAMRAVTKLLKGEAVEDKQKVLGYLYRERETTISR